MGLFGRKPARAMLRLSRGQWRLHPLDNGRGDLLAICEGAWTRKQPAELAAAVQIATGEQPRTELVLALDSDLCLATRFTAASRKQLRNTSALLYQLEETLPIAAEEVVADFRVHRSEVFSVACERDWLEAVEGTLQRAGMRVRAVAPLTLLALAEHTRRDRSAGEQLIRWRRQRRHDLVACRDGEPVDWRASCSEHEAVDQLLSAMQLDSGNTPVVTYGEELDGSESEGAGPLEEQAAATARRILSGDANPIMSLTPAPADKRQRSSGGAWPIVRGAALLLLLASAWRSHSIAAMHQQAAEDATNEQASVFREVFPDRRVPVGVRSHLASELRRLKGVRGEEGKTPQRSRAVLLVQQLLSAMPREMRLRVLEIRVEENRVYVEGQARSYSDTDRVTAALRTAGFKVSPPSTQKLPEKGVDFRLTAEPHSDSKQEGV